MSQLSTRTQHMTASCRKTKKGLSKTRSPQSEAACAKLLCFDFFNMYSSKTAQHPVSFDLLNMSNPSKKFVPGHTSRLKVMWVPDQVMIMLIIVLIPTTRVEIIQTHVNIWYRYLQPIAPSMLAPLVVGGNLKFCSWLLFVSTLEGPSMNKYLWCGKVES